MAPNVVHNANVIRFKRQKLRPRNDSTKRLPTFREYRMTLVHPVYKLFHPQNWYVRNRYLAAF